MAINNNNVSVQHNGGFLSGIILFKKNLNASNLLSIHLKWKSV